MISSVELLGALNKYKTKLSQDPLLYFSFVPVDKKIVQSVQKPANTSFSASCCPYLPTTSHLRLNGSRIGVCVQTDRNCVQTINAYSNKEYIFSSESLLNIKSISGFCFDDIDHINQREQIICGHDVVQH